MMFAITTVRLLRSPLLILSVLPVLLFMVAISAGLIIVWETGRTDNHFDRLYHLRYASDKYGAFLRPTLLQHPS